MGKNNLYSLTKDSQAGRTSQLDTSRHDNTFELKEDISSFY